MLTTDSSPTPDHPPPISLTDQILFSEADEGKFLLLRNDVGISRSILIEGCWARDDVRLFRRLIRTGDTVIDVGANIGHHSVVFARSVGGQGRVYCFEPQTIMFRLLNANLALNGCLNAKAYPYAVGECDGRMRMLPIDYETESNFGALGLSVHKEWCTGEEVTATRLDTFCRNEGIQQVDFIKIDVQTFELFVLKGARELLTRQSPILFVEISPFWMEKLSGYDFREIYSLLRSLGYQLYDKQMKPLDASCSVIIDKQVEWDVVAAKAERALRPLSPAP